MKFLTFDSPFVTGVDTTAPLASPRGHALPLEEAWAPHATDAHFVGYVPKGSDRLGRLRKGQEDYAETLGVEFRWLCFDIDNPGHERWESSAAAEAALYDALEALPPKLADAAGGYTTRAGLRLLWYLDTPIEVRHANHVLVTLGGILEALPFGDGVDPACFQWTRLYRAPRSRRDGSVLSSVTEDPAPLKGDIHKILEIKPTELRTAAPVDEDFPSKPLDVPEHIWAKNLRFPEVTRGEPFDLMDGEGSVFRAARAAMAHIAYQANVTNAGILISCVWRSLIASGREPDELWRMACWIAGQQEMAVEQAESVPTWDKDVPPAEADLPKVPESWWEAAKRLVDRAKPDGLREGFRRIRKQAPFKVARMSSWKVVEGIVTALEGTALCEDPAKVYAALLPSFRRASDIIDDEKDLWALCVEKASISWDVKSGKAETSKQDNALHELISHWPLILSTGQAYWILDARPGVGHYTYIPVNGEVAVPLMRKLQRDLPINIRERTEGGRGGIISPSMALDSLGDHVESIRYYSGLASAKFQDSGRTLLLPCHRRRDLTPTFHAKVDEWLQHLAGDQYEKLLRWIASAPKTLVGPTAALYIQGTKGSGKSLFFHALSKLWEGPVVDYNRAAQTNFNGALLDSPLLVADEGINPVYGKGTSSPSAIFRSYTANQQHIVERKYKDSVMLQAYLRVGITANNSHALPFRASLAKEGIEAITDRVMWVGVTQKAGDFLGDLFKDPGLRDAWVHGDVMAEHFAWVADRDVVSDGRFMVQGTETEWHRQFIRQQGIKPETLAAICDSVEFLAKGKTKAKAGMFWTKSYFCITLRNVLDRWEESSYKPARATLIQTLEALSDGTVHRSDNGQATGNQRFYKVPWDVIFESDILSDLTRNKVTSWLEEQP